MAGDACQNDAECTPPAVCNGAGQDWQKLVDPLNPDSTGEVFTAMGECIEQVTGSPACVESSDCAEPGQTCNTDTGSCERSHGGCVTDADCPGGALCSATVQLATCRDSDGDEVCDMFDNCVIDSNPGQEDVDDDGTGDTCDDCLFQSSDDPPLCQASQCGDAIHSPGEQCDDGNFNDGDGCESDCRLTPPTAMFAGRSLQMKDDVSVAKRRKMKISLRDEGYVAPAPGSDRDPRISGLMVEIANPVSGEVGAVLLPAGFWTGLGTPAGSKGYNFDGSPDSSSSCKATIREGQVGIRCGGTIGGFVLNAPSQQRLVVRLRSGSSEACLAFGGTIRADEGSATNGIFRAKSAPVPAACE